MENSTVLKVSEEKANEISRARSKYNDGKYAQLLRQWDYEKHEVMDDAIRKDDRVLIKDEVLDNSGRVIQQAEFETKKVNRISTSLEQTIVEIQTAFIIGLDPDLKAKPRNESESRMLEIIGDTERRNKMRFVNQRVVRSLLSETMVAEYWWSIEDPEFYEDKPYAGVARNRLRCEVWSPFRGDKLVPIKDAYGDLIRFYRFYSIKDDNGIEIQRLMEIDKDEVTLYEHRTGADAGWVTLRKTAHGFGKIPVVYMEMERALCDKIQSKRKRIEELESNFADCINDNFFPKVLVNGMVRGVQKSGKTQTIEMSGDGADVRYLTWDQSTNAAESEISRHIDDCFTLTMTPRISPKDLQGLGSALSGVAFKYVFMGAHISVRKHEEIIGEYLSRRYSFLKRAISLQVPAISSGRSLRVDPVLVPFTIEESTAEVEKPKNEADSE